MRDFATSDSPAVQAQLDRLAALSLPQGRFGLDTIHALLDRLGNPQRNLPPVFHVAGTNGKGSTCAFLRAMLEAQGYRIHAATKPHLVRYNERIRIAGKLIADDHLAALLKEVLDAGEDLAPSFFEITAAATFLAFHREPADACVIEVGLGGRFDATNVLDGQAACGIASLGIDHEAFLLVPEEGVPQEPLCRIAFEKAGIARPGVPLVTQAYRPAMTRTIIEHAMVVGAKTALRDLDWFAEVGAGIAYRDSHGSLELPLPMLAGLHQADNAALAVAMLRHQSQVEVAPEAMAQGIRTARWPARLQKLGPGPLTALVSGRTVWLDGGHNVDAGLAIAAYFRRPRSSRGRRETSPYNRHADQQGPGGHRRAVAGHVAQPLGGARSRPRSAPARAFRAAFRPAGAQLSRCPCCACSAPARGRRPDRWLTLPGRRSAAPQPGSAGLTLRS